MNLFLQELRKIWRPGILAALAVLGAVYYYIRPAFYIENFNNGPQAQAEFDLALDWVQRYGPTIEPEERDEIGKQLEAEEADFLAYAANSRDLTARGITDYDSFRAFEAATHDDYRAAIDRGDAACVNYVVYSGKTNYITIYVLRQFLEDYDGEVFYAEDGEPHFYADSKRLNEKCRERVQILRDRSGRSPLPEMTSYSTSAYAYYLAVWCMVSAVLLLSPALVRDRLHRMRSVQWASRRGRKVLRVQFAAALSSGLLLTVLNFVLYAVPFSFTQALRLWDCPLHSVQQSYPWFDWTYGQYLLFLTALVFALSLGASALTAVLSQYSGNYVAMLLKALPLIVVLAFFNTVVMQDAFYFSNAASRFLTLPGGEFLCAALLPALGLLSCAAACRRQRSREL